MKTVFPLGDETKVKQMEQQVLDLVQPGLSEEDIFWIRFECGEKYIREHMNVPPEVQEQLLRDRSFWQWFRAIWHMSDRKFLKACQREEVAWVDLRGYLGYHLKQMKTYKVNRVILKKFTNKNSAV